MNKDIIYREDAIKAVEDVSENYTKEGDREWHPHIDFITQALVQVSSVSPKRGEWIEFDTKWGRSLYYCTNCMETSEVPTAFGKPLYNFCPNCGADMRKGADDEH